MEPQQQNNTQPVASQPSEPKPPTVVVSDVSVAPGMTLAIVSLIAWLFPLVGVPVAIAGLIVGMRYRRAAIKHATTIVVLSIIGLLLSLANGFLGGYWAVKKEIDEQKRVTPATNTVGGWREVATNIEFSAPYVDSDFNYQIQVPTDWTRDTSGVYGSIVFFLGPVDDAGFTSNVNIVVENLYQPIMLDEYMELAKSQLLSFDDYQLLSERRVTVGDTPAAVIESSFTMEGSSLHNMQLITLDQNKAYVVTVTTGAVSWDTYKDTFESILQTFRLGQGGE